MADQELSSRTRRWGPAIQVAAAIIVTVVLFGISELFCGYYVAAWEKHRRPDVPGTDDQEVERGRRFTHDNPVPLVRDATVRWRNMPGGERTQPINPQPFGRDDMWTVKNNSEGFRGLERELKNQDDGVYRILFVGDSVTFGFNVDQDAPFARRVEEDLKRRYPLLRIEVINAGVIGWSWAQGVRFIESYGLALHPNLIVIGHGANDQFWHVRITDREHMWMLENPITRWSEAFMDVLTLSNTYRALLSVLPPPPKSLSLSPACELQWWETGGCMRVSLPEIEALVHYLARLTTVTGIDLAVLNVDFQETRAIVGVQHAVQRDGLALFDEVRRFRSLRLSQEFARAHELGLAPAHLPLLPRRLIDETSQEPRGARILFRVEVAQPAKLVSMRGAWSYKGDMTFDERMYDDGTHGDEVANDGVFSVELQAPVDTGIAYYLFYLDAIPEFEPVPPYTPLWAAREERFGDDGVAFIERFGDRFLMAERTHPDARGHEMIAADVLEHIERLPSFAKFIATEAAAS